MNAIEIEGLAVFAKERVLIQDLSLLIADRAVTVIIGASGSGKTTFLRTLNRLAEESDGLRVSGRRRLFGLDLERLDPNLLRQNVGMVFQKPCVFPGSIHKNVIFGPRHLGLCRRRDEAPIVEQELRRVGLWDEVRERLHDPAQNLSVGQQQRLCLARALALDPKVLLLDEPTSALDPLSVQKIEALVRELSASRAVVLVTHALRQARLLADHVAFMARGRLVESGDPARLFACPELAETREFISAAAE